MSYRADPASAFGQEPWAQRELGRLRQEYPHWAFLVVSYRWIALRGKQAVITAYGPGELRDGLLEAEGRSTVDVAARGLAPEIKLVPRSGAVGGMAGAGPGDTAVGDVPGQAVLHAHRSETGTWAAVAHPVRGWRRWPWPRLRRRTRRTASTIAR